MGISKPRFILTIMHSQQRQKLFLIHRRANTILCLRPDLSSVVHHSDYFLYNLNTNSWRIIASDCITTLRASPTL